MNLETIEGVTSPSELFGGQGEPRRIYKAWMKHIHPDVNPGEERRANEAVAKLNKLWDRFVLGRDNIFTFSTRRNEYVVTGPVFKDAATDAYRVFDRTDLFLRVPRAARTDDLMQREAAALKTFASVDGWDFPKAFTPELVEAAKTRDGRRFHVVKHATGLRTLDELHKLLPAGVRLRDLAWMMRRVLTGLSAAHKAGVLHGAPVPSNLAIQAELHGVVLTNWTSSAAKGERVLAVDPRYKKLIAPEVLRKETPTPASDIYTFARTFKLLAGDYNVPWFSAFIRGCSLEDPRMRPQSAYELRLEFDDLLERAFGPRRFVPFTWPDE